jgi:uncharacterized membrane protein
MATTQTPSATTQRLEAFSDGVIAIAITLLVLQIRIPHAKNGQLLDALLNQWPSYVAFIISFVVIGIMWVSHHSMFERIARVDRGLLFVNLALLLGIAFLPFPTGLLADYIRQGGSNSEIAAAIYSSTMVFIGLAFMGMWAHLVGHPHLLIEGIPEGGVRTALKRSSVSPIVYGFTVGLAFISPEACFVVYALIAAYFAAGPSARALRPHHHQDAVEPPVLDDLPAEGE